MKPQQVNLVLTCSGDSEAKVLVLKFQRTTTLKIGKTKSMPKLIKLMKTIDPLKVLAAFALAVAFAAIQLAREIVSVLDMLL